MNSNICSHSLVKNLLQQTYPKYCYYSRTHVFFRMTSNQQVLIGPITKHWTLSIKVIFARNKYLNGKVQMLELKLDSNLDFTMQSLKSVLLPLPPPTTTSPKLWQIIQGDFSIQKKFDIHWQMMVKLWRNRGVVCSCFFKLGPYHLYQLNWVTQSIQFYLFFNLSRSQSPVISLHSPQPPLPYKGVSGQTQIRQVHNLSLAIRAL